LKVSLEGTLSTIALPDVLALLSVTSKTGELRVESDGGVGRVWLDAGRIAGFDVGNQRSAVDALFALLRLPEGNFKFYTGTDPLNAIEPEEVNPLLEQADERLQEWPAIAAIVPSLSAELRLEPSATDDVLLTPGEWRLVSSVTGRTVEEVLTLMSLGEFDGCKAIKGLVERHLMKVDAFGVAPQLPVLNPLSAVETSVAEVAAVEPPVVEPPGLEAPAHDEELVQWGGTNGTDVARLGELPEVWNDEPGDVESTVVEDEPAEAGQPVNRGLLLKFLGSARS
jgi:Domain of unknown function (DUF4388)